MDYTRIGGSVKRYFADWQRTHWILGALSEWCCIGTTGGAAIGRLAAAFSVGSSDCVVSEQRCFGIKRL
jgi:hypothetical protein